MIRHPTFFCFWHECLVPQYFVRLRSLTRIVFIRSLRHKIPSIKHTHTHTHAHAQNHQILLNSISSFFFFSLIPSSRYLSPPCRAWEMERGKGRGKNRIFLDRFFLFISLTRVLISISIEPAQRYLVRPILVCSFFYSIKLLRIIYIFIIR